MRIDIVTVFPEMIEAALDHSIVKRARERELITVRVVNLRDYTFDRHKTTDDVPYGGGGGMVMKIEPIALALEDLTAGCEPPPRIAVTDPRGPLFTQETARAWSQEAHLILLCGHYEGMDERVRQHLVTDEISVGDYILTGGELPALIIVDSLTRLQTGALGDAQGAVKDTFTDNLLEYPHYTRPRSFRGWEVPEMLLSGHHARIESWRRWHQLQATRERRPDLFARLNLTPQDRKLLDAEEPQSPPDSRPVAMRTTDAPLPEPTAETDDKPRTELQGDTDGTDTASYS